MIRYTDDPYSILNFFGDPTFIDAFPRSERLRQGGTIGTVGSAQPLTSFMYDWHRPPITAFGRAHKFYHENYDIISKYRLDRDEKVFLGNKSDRKCRFCDGKEPHVTFKKDAHALPESLGNKTLFSYYECDKCNSLFGDGIENDFGNWSNVTRTLFHVDGKRRVPAIEQKLGQKFRVKVSSDSNLEVHSYELNPVMFHDEKKKEILLAIPRGSYTPMAVLKALVKMAVTILPDEEMPNFKQAFGWIKERNHREASFPIFSVGRTLMPRASRDQPIVLLAFRRKHDGLEVPYASFLIRYANEFIQVFLPCPERDGHIMDKEIEMPCFPVPSDARTGEKGRFEALDLTGTSIVKGEIVRTKYDYQTMTRIG